MAKSKKFRHTNTEQDSKFKNSGASSDSSLTFSFRFLCFEHEDCHFGEEEASYFLKVLERLKHVSTVKVNDFISGTNRTLRNHRINWEDTTQKDGFSHLNEQYHAYPPYQFSVSANEYGRIHGFIIGNVFHVVWLDPNHSVYSGKK